MFNCDDTIINSSLEEYHSIYFPNTQKHNFNNYNKTKCHNTKLLLNKICHALITYCITAKSKVTF